MSIPRCLRLAGSVCLVVGCFAGIPLRPAHGATAAPLPPDLPADARARLAAAAADPALPSGQHDLRLDVPDGGESAPPGPAPGTLALGEDPPLGVENDGAWSPFLLARFFHSTVYDPLRHRMLVFGGKTVPGASGVYLNDVWELTLTEPPTWAAITPVGTPPPGRYYHSVIYDPIRDRLIVFGGDHGVYQTKGLGDVWELSLSGTPTWTELTPGGTPPAPRRGHSAIYDPVGDRMVVFGGYDYDQVNHVARYMNDAWALTLSGTPTWSQLAPTGATPDGRTYHSAIYDPVGGHMVVFGGTVDGFSHDWTSSTEVWALSLTGAPVWSELTPEGPSPGGAQPAVYDPVRDRMVQFGGPEREVWALSLAGVPSWTKLTPAGTAAEVVGGHSVVYDPVGDRMVVFGGVGDGDDSAASTWTLALAGTPTWAAMTPVGAFPGRRQGHYAFYDQLRDRMVVFGGWDQYDRVRDVWTLSLAGAPRWEPLPVADTPPAAWSDAVVYDPHRDRLVAFGGVNSPVWALSLAGTPTWTQLAPSGAPGGSTRIYDPIRDRVVMYGGYNGWGHNDEVWTLSLSGTPVYTRLEIAPGPRPPGRWGPGSIYDPVRDRMIVFAGSTYEDPRGGYELYQNDVWALSLSGTPAWTELKPEPPAGPGGYPSAIYDPVRDRMVVFGGGFQTPHDATLALSLAGTPAWTQLTPTGTTPVRRCDHSAVYDPVRDRMIVFGGWEDYAHGNDAWMLTWGTPVRDVAVDIRPGDDGNAVNPWASGVLPVAILSTERFDATTVDPASVRLAGAGVRTRSDGTPMAVKEDVNGDGLADLVLHIESDALQLGVGDTLAHLTGMAPGNTTVRGVDHVRVVGRAARRPVPEASSVADESGAPALLGVRSVPGGGLRVSLALAPGAPATLDLVDVAGRRVQAVMLDVGARGPHEEGLGGAGLAPGVYWVRLRQAGQAFTRKAVVLR